MRTRAVPFNEQPLPLAANARAVADARRWVVEACRRMDREDLVEAAELGTSELVTNALLHAEPPFSVRLRGTPAHPRVEISDGSPKSPIGPTDEGEPGGLPFDLDPDGEIDLDALDSLDLDAVLTTFGRGLSMVSMASVAWGASMAAESKVVWFEPASVINEAGGPEPIIVQEAPPVPAPTTGTPVTVRLLGVDPTVFTAQRRQYANLRRELSLLALAHEDDYPLARNLGVLFTQYEETVAQTLNRSHDRTVAASGEHLVDLEVKVDPTAAKTCHTMIQMLDLADAFCREQRLLSLARSPRVREFQTWMLNQVVEQAEGLAPHSWSTRATAHVG